MAKVSCDERYTPPATHRLGDLLLCRPVMSTRGYHIVQHHPFTTSPDSTSRNVEYGWCVKQAMTLVMIAMAMDQAWKIRGQTESQMSW
mmetsp:Transcript_26161/g.35676  ORF Transcript_26161/g.35676 Transcript_26161/m.35676 type:complete len:88 (+) Transcript_26161:93-356(+)